MQPSIFEVAAPFEDSALVEVVDEGDEPTRWRSQLSRQGLLGLSWSGGDRAQQPGLRGSHNKVKDPVVADIADRRTSPELLKVDVERRGPSPPSASSHRHKDQGSPAG